MEKLNELRNKQLYINNEYCGLILRVQNLGGAVMITTHGSALQSLPSKNDFGDRGFNNPLDSSFDKCYKKKF
ncbi:MAG: hypothetical protein IKD89_02400 [Clostridia bacterium]|nr:hypothetical protein [Clostridia bacterium]